MSAYEPPNADAPLSNETTDAYNLDRQPTTTTRPDARRPSDTISTSYDAATGQVTSMSASSGETLNFAWDGGLLTSSALSGTVGGTETFIFNDRFLLSERDTNSFADATFAYDDDGLLTGAGSLSLTRSSQNGLLTATSVGSLATARGYDEFGSPSSDVASFGATTLLDDEYMRDKLGRILEKTETVGSPAVTTIFDYQYDDRGRLNQVKQNGAVTASYTFDANGNRLTGPLSTTSYSYDSMDRLTSGAGINYTYSQSGELEQKVDTLLNETTVYDYDALGNLRRVTLPTGDVIDYIVDAHNRRVGKRLNGSLVQGFLYENQLRPAAELDGTNAVVATFIYGTHVNVPDVIVKGGVEYRVITDQVGSVRLVVDSSTGTIAQQIDYDEFGNVLSDSNPGFQPFGFAGGVYDGDTGLVRFGARDYDALSGRWTNKDPILFRGGQTDLYVYVNDDPVNGSDTGGRWRDGPPEPQDPIANAVAFPIVVGGVVIVVAGVEIGTGAISAAIWDAVGSSWLAAVGSVGGGASSAAFGGRDNFCEPGTPESCAELAETFQNACMLNPTQYLENSPFPKGTVLDANDIEMFCGAIASDLEEICLLWSGIQ